MEKDRKRSYRPKPYKDMGQTMQGDGHGAPRPWRYGVNGRMDALSWFDASFGYICPEFGVFVNVVYVYKLAQNSDGHGFRYPCGFAGMGMAGAGAVLTTPPSNPHGFLYPRVTCKPAPASTGSRTRGHGCGFWRVRVRVNKNSPAGYPRPSLAQNAQKMTSVGVAWGSAQNGEHFELSSTYYVGSYPKL
ncbi:hypothetical protein BDZ97DRAFT_1764297 [Flammula alnicola]|nr:hypothetical protein BDZ97DRAFT_1764297 [Flammula alnicola]